MTGICWDISERKRAEQATQAQRQLLQIIIDHMPAAVNLIRGSDLRIQLVNPAYQAIAPNKEMVGKTLDDLWPETQRTFAGLCRSVLDTGEPHHAVDEPYTISRSPGGPLESAYFTWSLFRIRMPGDEGWAILNTAWETTARKQVEEQLARSLMDSQERAGEIEAVLAAINDAVLVYDAAMNVVRVNPGFIPVYGFDPIGPKRARPHRADECRSLDGRPLSLENQPTPRALRGEPVVNQHFRITRLDGQERALETSAMPLLVGDRIVGTVTVWHDITERQRAAEALRQLNESLEQRVAERTTEVQRLADQLRALAVDLSQAEQRERRRLSKILHDHIQQLLVAARMQVEWLKRDTDAERMRATAQGVDGILREALDASRSLTIELSPPVLHELGLIGGLNWLTSRMQEKHQFRVHLRSDNKAEPASEETRYLLFECVREILFNAVKHAGVKEAHVALLRSRDNRIKLIIHDEGKGFDPDLLKKRTADKTTFGLFSIQQRLAHIGGEMEIVTAPGKGTSITVTLPVDEAIPPTEEMAGGTGQVEKQGKVQVRGRTSVRRVLVVDDHKIMREGLVGLMQFEPDIEVVGQAADGPQAIELAEQLQPDVIIMDVNLGEMSGVEATKHILAKFPDTKVIGLSMHTNNDLANAMRAAGAITYLTKGGPAEDLIAAIRAACAD